MSTALTVLDSGVPAHLSSAFNDLPTNIVSKDNIPSLSFRGSKWRLKINGEETVLSKTIDDEEVPIPTIQVIVLGVHANRSRNFFEGSFVEGENKQPTCWSTNGVTPDSDVTSPCAKTCASCPNSVKGSKISENGKEMTACATLRRLVVVPSSRLDSTPPLLLKVPQTSMWDKDNKDEEAKGFYAWDQYVAFLRARGVPHTAAVVTKIKFDQKTAYPKLLFSAVGWVSDDKAGKVKELVLSKGVKDLLEGVHNAVPETTTSSDDDDDGFESQTPAVTETKPAAKKRAAPKQKPVVEKAPVVEDDDDGFGDPAVVEKQAAPVKPSAAKAPQESEAKQDLNDVDSLLDGWDD